ncbi:YdcF family protein [Litoribacter alkaliphilus]|uniref:YdcF family protein n=1 Tax=Litoribacter ruber TaxID=702568 RepID=A0AAP2CHF9_9BACT|nr:YdcF family protein [Litoribacter alkaliphilus]MBS9524776.1 YdcF family protein [Litoribacter alkaliphilus]
MVYFLSQIFSFLILPLTIILILFISGLIMVKKPIGRKLLWASLILLLLMSNRFLANKLMNAWEPQFKEIATLPTYEVGIVLTGVTNINKTASDRTFFDRGADRATHAMQLYKEGKINKILITGGEGFYNANTNREADLLANFMYTAGVPMEDVIIENQAVNTRENALFARETLIGKGFDENETYLLITSAFHMPRSKKCFDKVGLQTETYPVDYYGSDSGANFKSLFQPAPDALMIWQKMFKEWAGLLVYKLVGYI